jgi:hypothetical protein
MNKNRWVYENISNFYFEVIHGIIWKDRDIYSVYKLLANSFRLYIYFFLIWEKYLKTRLVSSGMEFYLFIFLRIDKKFIESKTQRIGFSE